MTQVEDCTGRLVLASTSKYRAELLRRLDVPFRCVDSGIDERREDDLLAQLGPSEFALHLARLKAAAAVRHCTGDEWIVAADQVAILETNPGTFRLLHKPKTHERAIEQVRELAGRRHELVTGVVLRSIDGQQMFEAHDRHVMTMRRASDREIEDYVRSYAPLDCAGGYRIEDAGIKLFEKIEGNDFTGIIGLPLLALSAMMRQAGLLPADAVAS
jgi:septum formation protein